MEIYSFDLEIKRKKMSTTEFIKSKISEESLQEAAEYSKKQNKIVIFKGFLSIAIVASVFIGIFYLLQKKIENNKESLQKGSLRTFLVKTGIIKVALGFFISTQVLIFINEIINATIAPLIAHLINRKQTIKELRAQVFGITFEFGNLIVAFIRLMFVLLLVYFIYFLITINGFDIYA